MPANPGPGERDECPAQADLADAELAAIVRGAANEDGMTGEFYNIALRANCALDAGHAGLHAGWIATTNGDPSATCWLRWNDTARVVDWLVACVDENCLLYRGHTGTCDLMGDDGEAANVG